MQIGGVYETSTFNGNRRMIEAQDLSSDKMDGVFKLFNALVKVKDRSSIDKVFQGIKKVIQKRSS